jgi:hypothetical protein
MFLKFELAGLEIWENPIKGYGYWHFGHGDFIFHKEPQAKLFI